MASDKKISMSSTALDEHDKMKEMWAFNMPCMLLVNNGRLFWTDTARDVYKMLYKDVLIKIRVSLAASLIEIVKLINLKEDTEEANEDRTLIVEVANHLLSDEDQVRIKLLPNLCELISHFPEENQKMLLQTMIRERIENEKGQKSRKVRIELIEKLFQTFPPGDLVDANFHKYIYEAIKGEPYIASRVKMS